MEADDPSMAPVALEADFGCGKSHLLSYFRDVAEQRGFVTSTVVLSPETPLGNTGAVLREIARNATAPKYTGDAYRQMAAAVRTDTDRWADLRRWAREADINARFPAMLYLYEEEHADEEFRVKVLDDLQGMPLAKTEIMGRLRRYKQAAGWDLKGGPRNAALAHDRIRVLSRLARAMGAPGLVVLFDEVERLATFTFKQRLAAYEELAWWVRQSREPGSAIATVWMCNQQSMHAVIMPDYGKVAALAAFPAEASDRDTAALEGHGFLTSSFQPLFGMTDEELADTQYRVGELYKAAYGLAELPPTSGGDRSSVRRTIRRWIATWDLERIYPGYAPTVTETEMAFDTSEVDDSVLEFDSGGGGE